MSAKTMSVRLLHTLAFAWIVGLSGTASAAPLSIAETPLFLNGTVAPLNLLVIGRDHKLYYEAYNDASDLNADGVLDTRYKGYELKVPAPTDSTESIYKIDYFGYFDSFKCYTHNGARFEPVSATGTKMCPGQWSGDYLNYLTTSRIDALRKVLYGGDRFVDDVGETVLERSYIPQDAHSWGKEYDPAVDGYNITDYTPLGQPTTGTRHLFANTTPRGGGASDSTLYNNPPLLRYLQNMPSNVRIWNWLSKERPVAHRATNAVENITLADGDFTDLIVRVKVCATTPAGLLEPNCKLYDNGTSYKPTGILQDYGEGTVPRMYFGLMTGSYARNTNGGVLRARMGSGTSPLSNEISPTTGQFLNLTDAQGAAIIKTLTRMHPTGFGTNYEYDCGWDYAGGPLPNGRCQMWGNPIAEIMYEGMRYLGGRGVPVTQFNTTFGQGNEGQLPYGGLPVDSWNDPYNNQPRCAKPFQTVISDINPSYDSDRLPGSNWAGTLSHNDLPGSMNVATLGQTIWDNEFGAGNRNIFIGQSGTNSDNAPTAKTVNSFGNIRGLAPEEPTKQGSYYSASVAYHGHKTDIHSTKAGVQEVTTFAVGLASPLPKIEIPINGRLITLVPFAKSPGGSVGAITFDPASTAFQPTNQIVDFYVDQLTSTYGRFRVNFEDVEFGADHDMDAIVIYEYQVTGSSVAITLTSEYAAGSIKQHMGYIISGTTADGIYMEVRDQPASISDVDYFLDTPPAFTGIPPAAAAQWADGVDLPFTTTRTFSAGATPGADLLKNPLWYAAKWGGFQDANNNDLPDQTTEWDEDGDGDPDNYFLVTNALNLGAQLSAAFEELLERVGSASAASVNAGSISSETRVYQAKFNSGDWSGQLLSFPVNADGTLQPFEWDAAEEIPAPNSRVIITTNADTNAAVPFTWTAIGATRQGELQPAADALGSDRLDFLRGDDSNEFPSGQFRDRVTKLGDIVSSSPTFVGPPAFFYRDTLEAQPYSAFVAAQAGRQKMVYAGANDGMLHGFAANDGRELLAYIPSAVFPNLHHLTNRNYTHKFYVDGTPTYGDVFYNNAWHSVLVGGLNRGGRSIYALDITSPAAFTEGNAASILRWEFTDTELGYTYSRPAVVRMHNGRWAAVFGNGYNNTGTGRAYLYVVDIENGTVTAKIDTGVGDATTPNGLATPALVDLNGDSIVDYAYAGDLQGNMWKFNLTSNVSTGWRVAYDNGSGVPLPIFVATDGAATPTRQPITSRPEVGRGPRGVGMMVLFGTGKFLENGDKNPGPKQSFYGIYDPNTNTSSDRVTSRTLLTAQTILAEVTVATRRLRVTSENPVPTTSRGWYMDLLAPPNPPGTLQGEMQVSNSILRNGRIIFTTLIPDPDVCSSGGTSWLMELDSLTGGRLAATPFDLNGDNLFNNDDMITVILPDGSSVTVFVSGVGSEVGITETPGILSQPGTQGGAPGQEFKYLSGSAASPSGSNLQRLVENPGPNSTGRQSWRQIK